MKYKDCFLVIFVVVILFSSTSVLAISGSAPQKAEGTMIAMELPDKPSSEMENLSGSYPFPTEYPSVNELYTWYDDLVNEYPDLVEKHHYGYSWEGRDLWALEITSNEDTVVDEKPAMLLDGGIHAREWSGPQVVSYFTWRILNEYDTNETINWLVNNRKIFVVPQSNPDGYIYDGNGDLSQRNEWRKNRNASVGDDSDVGVDLNRNADIDFGGAGARGDPSADTYHGEAPFSENETSSLRDLILDNGVDSYHNIHSHAGTLLIPYMYTNDTSPHDSWYRSTADDMTSFTSKLGDETDTYSYGQPEEEIGYSASGGMADWAYAKKGLQGLTFEIYTPGDGTDGFYPATEYIMDINKDLDDSLIYQARVADADLGNGTDHEFPPPPYILYGQVKNSTGSPVSNVKVDVVNQRTGEQLSINTDSNGYYEFDFAGFTGDGYNDSDDFKLKYSGEEKNFNINSEWGKRIDLELSEPAKNEINIPLHAGGESEGWNLVSFNLDVPDTSLTSILDDPSLGIQGNYDKVMYYDALDSKWRSYLPQRAEHYNDLQTWDHTRGLWIHMKKDDNLTLQGAEPSSTQVTLEPGWNMVGYPGSTVENNGLPGEVDRIGYMDGSVENNIVYTEAVDSYQFEPKKGYWIHNPTDSTLVWEVNY
ncbi:MAG: hypothetical protein KGY76_05300 [Candidatus Thermoplasmatota archaeon]|nr:hypothetical protein [Candidatus Thermoplasmatota archaeon]